MVNICDVYDLENKKILSQKTFTEISEIIEKDLRRFMAQVFCSWE